MNTREKVLKEALNCVNGEREKQYGNPEDNFRRIADLWSVYLTSLFEDEKVVVDIDPIDVAKMMILFKIARSNGDKDKLDNYVDMIGYGACAAEIFECSEKAEKVLKKKEELGVQLADECKDCDYAKKCIGTGVCLKEEEKKWFDGCDAKKDKPDEKCNRKDCGQFDSCMTAYQHYIYNKTKEASEAIDEARCLLDQKDPYSYAHDKLLNYIEDKIREKWHKLENLKSTNGKLTKELSEYLHQAATDCVGNGKRFLDCYKEIDDMFEKYIPDKNKNSSIWQAYSNITAHIALKSSRANIDSFDVVDQLIKKGNAPTDMAALLQDCKLNFDDIASYVEDAINEVKKKENVKCILKQVKDKNGFNEAAEQMVQKLKEDKKITRGVEVPEGFDISYIYMTDAGQIIVRFNPTKEDKK